ncbi:porin family protein [Ekhidna sp. To15]|uniref:porin family protein n=1 Tax=Ekhidna sp. To15 TaxID=3395267 RepID=UPI003F5225D4
MRLYPLIFSVLISFKIFGQDIEFREYIVIRDSSKYVQGEVFYDKANPNTLNFRKFKNDPIKEFNSSEILEFRTKDGSVYSSELIRGEYQFLKQLITDENALLLLEKRRKSNQIFYMKNSTLLELQRESLKHQIKAIIGNKRYGSQIAKGTKYNELSISRAVTYSNSDKGLYPKARYGVLAGLNGKSIELESDKTLSFESVSVLSYGAFVDLPIGVFSQFSTRVEIQFSESSHSLFIDEGTTADYLAKIQSISLPVLLRYRFNSNNRINFFSNLGPNFKYNFVSSNQIITVSESPRVIGIEELIVPDQMLGGAVGAGVEYSLSYGKDLGFEVRYQHLVSTEEVKMTESAFQVICTFNF